MNELVMSLTRYIVKCSEAYLKKDDLVIIGTNDKEYSLFKEICEKKSVKALYIEGADHSLEISSKPFASIQALEEVLRRYQKKEYNKLKKQRMILGLWRLT